jgi:hypothetical protein
MSVTGSASFTSLHVVDLTEPAFAMQARASLEQPRYEGHGNWSCFQAIGRILLWATRNGG